MNESEEEREILRCQEMEMYLSEGCQEMWLYLSEGGCQEIPLYVSEGNQVIPSYLSYVGGSGDLPAPLRKIGKGIYISTSEREPVP